MAIDQPLVIYKKDKKKLQSKKDADKAADEWYKKRQEKGSVLERIKLSEFFNTNTNTNTIKE